VFLETLPPARIKNLSEKLVIKFHWPYDNVVKFIITDCIVESEDTKSAATVTVAEEDNFISKLSADELNEVHCLLLYIE